MQIVLASASPRRQELLRQIHCDCTVITNETDEDNLLPLPPAELVVHHARNKAVAVAATLADRALVIGADTLVVQDGVIFGKPQNREDALRMLTLLSGKEHKVMTGVAVAESGTGRLWTDCAVTTVTFAALTPEEIERYAATDEPLDKAGAYAIQGRGALLVDRLDGCYSNVVGLPLSTLRRLLNRAGVQLL